MDSFVFGVDENNNAALRVSPGQGETNQKDIFTTDENGNAAIRVIGAGGGGGSVDYNRVIEKSSSIPAASSDNYRKVYMYVGDTNVTYTHGYIYECQKTSATYTGTVSFEAATLSGTTVTCDGDDFANFLTEAGADPTPIVSGTITYDAGADGWRLVGKDAEDNTVTNFIEYTEDYTDHGFVFTGTPVDGDVIGFTCSVSESSATYGWVRLDVQPAPSAIKVNTTITLASANWSDNSQTVSVTGITADGVVLVSPVPSDQSAYTSAGILCTAQAAGTLTFTCDTVPSGDVDVNVVCL